MMNLNLHTHERHQSTRLALIATFLLTVIKIWAAWISGSVGVLSEGIHSSLDLISACLAWFAVREAIKPADDQHPFGHGKFETLSALFESLLLVLAALYMMFEAVHEWYRPHPIQASGISIGVMVFSILLSLYVFLQNHKVAEASDSMALKANALHFLADVLTSLAVLIGLFIMRWTEWWALDALLAGGVALFVLRLGLKQGWSAVAELVDEQLPDEEQHRILSLIREKAPPPFHIEAFRSRKSGSFRHIDFHLQVCGQLTVSAAHQLCDAIEGNVLAEYPGTEVKIHVEPCPDESLSCKHSCIHFS